MSERNAKNFQVKSQFLLTVVQVPDLIYFFYLQGIVHKFDKGDKIYQNYR